MVEEDITPGEMIEAMTTGTILEDYPQHRRGPCCLVAGETADGRPLHVICTTDRPLVVVITTCEPGVRPHGRVVVIDGVPAEVGSVCGDVLLKPDTATDTVRRIEAILHEAGEPDRTAPVYEYAA